MGEKRNREYLIAFRIAKFTNVNHLTLFFPSNFGGDHTRIHYIGLKGDFTQVRIKERRFLYLMLLSDEKTGSACSIWE